jgi:beta-xylosidase
MTTTYIPTSQRVMSKLGRRIAWATFVAVASLWMAAQATNQDLASFMPHLGASTTAATNAASGYGFSTSLSGLTSDQLNARIAAMKATGATWVRYDLSWDSVQPASANTYDWTESDAVTKAAQAQGMKVLMIIDFVPAWAREAGCKDSKMCAPADPAAYGRFAAAAAAHYQPYGVGDFEIWNEPNISFRFRPAANPTTYVAMLKASYTDIKQVDPSAVVIAASTAPTATDTGDYSPSDFLNAMYNAGAGGYFDAISAHPYTYPVTPAQSAPTDAWGQLVGMHNTMAAHGDGNKQIWITEFGAPTNGPNIAGDHVSEAVQAQIATEAVTLFRKWNWSGPFFWYDYQDDGTSTADSQNFFGLVRADGSFKPAYYAYKAAIAANSN